MPDLDQGGTFRETTRIYQGPSLGWSQQVAAPPVSAITVTTAGTTVVQQGVSAVHVNVNAGVTIQLYAARGNAAGAGQVPGSYVQVTLTVNDIGGNAQAFPITILPAAGETIGGASAVTIAANYGLFVLLSDVQNGGWTVASGVSGTALTDGPNDGSAYGRQSAAWAKVLPLAGGTLTGALVLNADPAVALGAATKQYVDGHPGEAPSDNNYYTRRNAAWANGASVFVRYDVAQGLSVANQRQAQANVFIAPTTQVFTTGSGTYTTPAGCLWIEVEMVGGGGGGAGSGTSPGAVGSAGASTFGSSLLTANGGGAAGTSVGGVGGTASGGYLNKTGVAGGNGSGVAQTRGGAGGNSPLGGAGAGGAAGAGAGIAAVANSGSGGGGGGVSTVVNGGGGGGAAGYLKAIIASPSATYAYAVGAGGTGGTAGTSGAAGANGGSGLIVVKEFYGS